MAPTLKLIYFEVAGRAEATRIILRYAGIPFENFTVTQDAWPQLKSKTPFGQVPVLEVDGKPLAQQAAIERYVANLAGLIPSDSFLAAKVDEVKGLLVELQDTLAPTRNIQDAGERFKARQALAAGPVKDKLTKLSAVLEAAGGEYFVGGYLTYADVAVYTQLSILASGFLDGVPGTLLNDYPLLKAHHQRVAAVPKIAEQYASVTEGFRLTFKTLP